MLYNVHMHLMDTFISSCMLFTCRAQLSTPFVHEVLVKQRQLSSQHYCFEGGAEQNNCQGPTMKHGQHRLLRTLTEMLKLDVISRRETFLTNQNELLMTIDSL